MTGIRRDLPLPILLAWVIVMAACSGDRSAPPSTATTAQARNPAAVAASVNLTLEDLPAEFVAVPGDGDDDALGGCAADFQDDVLGQAEAPRFERRSRSGLASVASSTAMFADDARGAAFMAFLKEESTLECLRQMFAERLIESSPSATVEAVTLSPAASSLDLGDDTLVLEGTMTVSEPRLEAPFDLIYSLVVVRTGEVATLLYFTGLGEPFPGELIPELTATVAERQSRT